MTETNQTNATNLTQAVAALLPADYSGTDLRVITEQAIRDGITDAAEIAQIARDARADATAERAHDAREAARPGYDTRRDGYDV